MGGLGGLGGWRTMTMALAMVGIMIGLAACGGDTSTPTTAPAGPTTGAAGPAAGGDAGAPKKTLVVGFSQVGAESVWRTANTASIKDEAAKRGIDLQFSDAQQKQENQIKALNSFIAKKVDLIILAPVIETGWDAALQDVKDAGIPVIIEDRRPAVNDSLYATFIGADFVEEGRKAAEWMAKHTDGKAQIAELQGTTGSAPANDRKKGFEEVLAKYPDMKIIMSQTGNFTKVEGKEVMEAFLKNPDAKKITAVFAHNDDMALGAIQAIEDAGLKPGKDIMIVSIDGVAQATFEAIRDGKLNCSVECNPLLGPQVFDVMNDVLANKPVPKRTVVKEGLFDSTNWEVELPRHPFH